MFFCIMFIKVIIGFLGQWTPTNPNGFKIYQKDFLLALKDCPNSKIKPENILDLVALDDRAVSCH